MHPRDKGRPLHTAINGSVRVYTPKETRKWEQQVGVSGLSSRPDEVIEGPVRGDILAVMPRPKRLLGKNDPDEFIWCTGKPE